MMSIHQWTEMLKPSGQRVKCQGNIYMQVHIYQSPSLVEL